MIPIYWDNGWNGDNGLALFDRNNGAIVDQGSLDALMQGVDTGTSVKENRNPKDNKVIEFITASPNPVSVSTDIQLSLKKAAHANINIFNILGQKVASFNDLNFMQGINSVSWNAGNVPTGTYFIIANNGEQVLSRKVLVIH